MILGPVRNAMALLGLTVSCPHLTVPTVTFPTSRERRASRLTAQRSSMMATNVQKARGRLTPHSRQPQKEHAASLVPQAAPKAKGRVIKPRVLAHPISPTVIALATVQQDSSSSLHKCVMNVPPPFSTVKRVLLLAPALNALERLLPITA